MACHYPDPDLTPEQLAVPVVRGGRYRRVTGQFRDDVVVRSANSATGLCGLATRRAATTTWTSATHLRQHYRLVAPKNIWVRMFDQMEVMTEPATERA